MDSAFQLIQESSNDLGCGRFQLIKLAACLATRAPDSTLPPETREYLLSTVDTWLEDQSLICGKGAGATEATRHLRAQGYADLGAELLNAGYFPGADAAYSKGLALFLDPRFVPNRMEAMLYQRAEGEHGAKAMDIVKFFDPLEKTLPAIERTAGTFIAWLATGGVQQATDLCEAYKNTLKAGYSVLPDERVGSRLHTHVCAGKTRAACDVWGLLREPKDSEKKRTEALARLLERGPDCSQPPTK